MPKDELIFVAEGKSADGKVQEYYAYKSGGSFYIRGPNFYRHLCHPSVKDYEGVKHEIALVFEVSVTDVKFPSDLHPSRPT